MPTETEDYAKTANTTAAFDILGSLQSAKKKSNTSQVGIKLRKRTKRELASSSDLSYPANHLFLSSESTSSRWLHSPTVIL